ncbi:MAG: class I SAM-dependent methyltransferase [Chloroflexi bacterium]|nr:class I SAM-dependent methyltransferase [Chloroflexota bacterium]
MSILKKLFLAIIYAVIFIAYKIRTFLFTAIRNSMPADESPMKSGDTFYDANLKARELWEKNKDSLLKKAVKRRCPFCNSDEYDIAAYTQDGYELACCKVCRMVYIPRYLPAAVWDEYSVENPFLDEANMETIGMSAGGEVFERDKERFGFYLKNIRKFKSGGKLLDVGCFTGNSLVVARDLGYEAYGLESRPLPVEFAREKRGFDVRQGKAEDLGSVFPGEKFDVITLWETLEHLADPGGIIRSLSDALNPGGILAVTTPNWDNTEIHLLKEHCFHITGSGYLMLGHINLFSPRHLIEFLEKYGCRTVDWKTHFSSNYRNMYNYWTMHYERIDSYANYGKTPGTNWRNEQEKKIHLQTENLIAKLYGPLSYAENLMKLGPIMLVISKKG